MRSKPVDRLVAAEQKLIAGSAPVHVPIRALVFNSSPLVIIGAVEHEMYTGPASVVSPRLKGRPYWMLLKLHWSMESRKQHAALAVAYRRHAEQFPEHRLIYLCNTERELLALQQAGVPSLLCNHNIFVCDRTFDVVAGASKEFDAIYNARPSPYKRHELCAEVPRVALIYYPTGNAEWDHVELLRSRLPNATFINDAEAAKALAGLANPRAREFVKQVFAQSGHLALRPERVAAFCNRARVGLCLSAVEGAMYASMEYLLCGLPVVSTVSRGGRDFYFDPDFCSVVPPEPTAIAKAVQELIARRIPAEYIRSRSLARVAHDRSRFVRFVQAIYEEERAARDASEDWDRVFVHTMTDQIELDTLVGSLF